MTTRIRMPFGRHRGKLLPDVPFDYLVWGLNTCTNLDPWLRRAIEVELRERTGEVRPSAASSTDSPAGPSGGPLVNVEKVVKSWFREMAMRHHPDRGGDHKVMVALIDA